MGMANLFRTLRKSKGTGVFMMMPEVTADPATPPPGHVNVFFRDGQVRAEGNTGGSATGELPTGPAQSETLCMRGHSLHGNREVPPTPVEVGTTDRLEKATSRTSSVHVGGKSDRPIVPKKPPNNGGLTMPPAEAVEERGLTEGNIGQTAVPRTQGRTRTSNGLVGVRRVAREETAPVSP